MEDGPDVERGRKEKREREKKHQDRSFFYFLLSPCFQTTFQETRLPSSLFVLMLRLCQVQPHNGGATCVESDVFWLCTKIEKSCRYKLNRYGVWCMSMSAQSGVVVVDVFGRRLQCLP